MSERQQGFLARSCSPGLWALALRTCIPRYGERAQQLEGCKDQRGNEGGPRLGRWCEIAARVVTWRIKWS